MAFIEVHIVLTMKDPFGKSSGKFIKKVVPATVSLDEIQTFYPYEHMDGDIKTSTYIDLFGYGSDINCIETYEDIKKLIARAEHDSNK